MGFIALRPSTGLQGRECLGFVIRLAWLLSSVKLEPEHAGRKQGGRGLNLTRSQISPPTLTGQGASSLSFKSSAWVYFGGKTIMK